MCLAIVISNKSEKVIIAAKSEGLKIDSVIVKVK